MNEWPPRLLIVREVLSIDTRSLEREVNTTHRHYFSCFIVFHVKTGVCSLP